MTSIVKSGGGDRLPRFELRQTQRNFDRMEARGLERTAGIVQEADLQVTRAQAVAHVGQAGMQAVAMVSQFEAQLGQACPMAVTRLQGIADMTALGVAEVVADTVRRVGR